MDKQSWLGKNIMRNGREKGVLYSQTARTNKYIYPSILLQCFSKSLMDIPTLTKKFTSRGYLNRCSLYNWIGNNCGVFDKNG